MYDHCYHLNKKKYDWFMFLDVDEFIFLKNFKNVKHYLSRKRFNDCKGIYLNWALHTDSNQLHYENKSLFERFPEVRKNKDTCVGKSIIRGNLEIFNSKSVHTQDQKIPKCNGFGNIINITQILFCERPDYKYFYIDHFQHKSTEEFASKIIKGDCIFGNQEKRVLFKIYNYFRINKLTKEKFKIIQYKTGFNTSYLLYHIKNNIFENNK
jgi:hypothetical protein